MASNILITAQLWITRAQESWYLPGDALTNREVKHHYQLRNEVDCRVPLHITTHHTTQTKYHTHCTTPHTQLFGCEKAIKT